MLVAEPYAHRHQPLGPIKVLEPAPPELRHYVRLIIVTRLVDHEERIQRVDALECRLIGVGGFAARGDELLARRTHVPLVIEDSSGERSFRCA
jgi:hypothetical protein